MEKSQNKALYAIIGLLTVVIVILLIALYRQNNETKSIKAIQSFQRETSQHPAQNPASQNTFDLADEPFLLMDQIMQQFLKTLNSASRFEPMMSGAFESWTDFSPAIDLEDTPQAYRIRADLPGMEKDQINITVQNRYLTIQGTRKSEQISEDQRKGYYAQERSYGSFSRSLVLPGPVDETGVKADYQNGVLTIILPKLNQDQEGRKVAVE